MADWYQPLGNNSVGILRTKFVLKLLDRSSGRARCGDGHAHSPHATRLRCETRDTYTLGDKPVKLYNVVPDHDNSNSVTA